MDSTLFVAILVFLVPLAGVAWFVYARLQADKRAAQNRVAMGAIGFDVAGGTYATGHPEIATPCPVRICINDAEFLLVSTWDGRRLGGISRHAVTGLDVHDATTIQTDKRYTLTRVALLGVLALAVPKQTELAPDSWTPPI